MVALCELTPPSRWGEYLRADARGLRVPQDVSLVCTDNDPDFA